MQVFLFALLVFSPIHHTHAGILIPPAPSFDLSTSHLDICRASSLDYSPPVRRRNLAAVRRSEDVNLQFPSDEGGDESSTAWSDFIGSGEVSEQVVANAPGEENPSPDGDESLKGLSALGSEPVGGAGSYPGSTDGREGDLGISGEEINDGIDPDASTVNTSAESFNLALKQDPVTGYLIPPFFSTHSAQKLF